MSGLNFDVADSGRTFFLWFYFISCLRSTGLIIPTGEARIQHDCIYRALWDAPYCGHVHTIVAEIGIDDVGFFRSMGTNGVAGAGKTAGITDNTEVRDDSISHTTFLSGAQSTLR